MNRFLSFCKLQVPVNIFHFSRSPGDFSVYDISACYEDHSKLHLMVNMSGYWLCVETRLDINILIDDTNCPQIRMGWTQEMDIEGTKNLFERSVREVKQKANKIQ